MAVEPRQGETRRPRVAKHTFDPVESRTGCGPARSRLPDGESLRRPQTELMVRTWHTKKPTLEMQNIDARAKQELLYKLADICTDLTRHYRGVVGEVARALGGL